MGRGYLHGVAGHAVRSRSRTFLNGADTAPPDDDEATTRVTVTDLDNGASVTISSAQRTNHITYGTTPTAKTTMTAALRFGSGRTRANARNSKAVGNPIAMTTQPT